MLACPGLILFGELINTLITENKTLQIWKLSIEWNNNLLFGIVSPLPNIFCFFFTIKTIKPLPGNFSVIFNLLSAKNFNLHLELFFFIMPSKIWPFATKSQF